MSVDDRLQNARGVAVLRLSGEVSTKAAATRRYFVKRLVRNVKDALLSEGFPAAVIRFHERLYVPAEDARVLDPLSRVFGLQSMSFGERLDLATLPEVTAACVERFAARVAGRRFAVRSRRVGSLTLPFRSREVEVAVGSALLPGAAGVDLDDPEVTVAIEFHRSGTYLFAETRPGAGGLPLGTEGRAIALVSGGFDSAVAAWLLLRRGVRLDYLFCNLGGRTHEQGVLRVMKIVADRWSYGDRPKLVSVDFEPVVRALREHTEPRYWQILLKREMVRAAEGAARARGADAIVTGEAVGQVSSQTLRNLAVISEATTLPILRPLVGFHKHEIIERAEWIGTAELSAVVAEYCAIAPSRPSTAAQSDRIAAQDARLDRAALDACFERHERLDLRVLDPAERGLPDLEVEKIPDGALLLDVRTRGEYDRWHAPEALHLDFAQAQRAYPSFSRDQVYVLYCDFGLKSGHLAEQMRESGLRAHHFRGGTRALRRALEREG